jgi:para-nitrobenzyl esterase
MLYCLRALALAAAAATAVAAAQEQPLPPPPQPLTVHTAAGPIVGRRLQHGGRSIDEFLGAAYAAPPTGSNRWRPPQPLAPWTAPRLAAALAPPCPQNRDPGFGNVSGWSEDCLYLNVWAPSNKTGLPVLLWLYGGGWQDGSAAQPLYDGRNLSAAQDVVLVVPNWRDNVFGFLGLTALQDEEQKRSGQRTSGFYGQQDQRAAMIWVRDNIEQFGGDPGKVALWGQSAGAGAICYHMLLPRSRGLFSRAIIDSSCIGFFSPANRPIGPSAGFASSFGCSGTNVSCLRAIPAAALNAALNSDYAVRPIKSQHWFYPLWDPSEWPAGATSMESLWNGGNFTSPVPVLIGSTLDEKAWEFCGDACQAEWPAPFNVSVPATEFDRVFAATLSGSCPHSAIEAASKLYALGTFKAASLVNVMGMIATDTATGMGSCIGMNVAAAAVADAGVPSFLWVLARLAKGESVILTPLIIFH